MANRKRWSDLSEGARKLIITGAVIEGMLKVAALADLRHRPSGDVRGPKWIWAAVILLVNSFGGAPIAYFAFGRRQRVDPTDR
jgi:hypothetical protein